MKDDTISRQAAIDALRKALYEYEDKTEKQFQESEDLDIRDWMVHRIFVQNMSDIDRQTILDLPSTDQQEVQSSECKYWDDESNFCALYRPSTERHGRWIKENDVVIHGRCSSCGWNAIWQESDVFGMPYCPNCGAKMDEIEE